MGTCKTTKSTMKVFATVCAIGVALAIPAPQEALKPESHDELPEMFLNLMKDVMVPPKEGSATDPILKDVVSMIGSLAHPSDHHDAAQGKAEQDPMMSLLNGFMSMKPSSGKGGDGVMNDPVMKMMTMMAQTALQSSNTSDSDGDPLMRMGTTAVKAFLDTMNDQGPTGSGEHDLEEHAAPHHASAQDDPTVPIMKLMAKCVQALTTDKSGDPVGTVMNVVLADPLLSDNPVIKAIKAATEDKTGDPLNAMIDSLSDNPEIQKDPYVPPILRIAKNVIHNMPKDGENGDPLAALLNALAPPPTPKNPHKVLVSPEVPSQ